MFMIGYLEGKILKIDEDRILLLAGPIGYEVLLPAFVMETLRGREVGDEVSFYIYHQQTERQPKPVLIGFHLEAEREFFQRFISVADVGPLKAVKALTVSVRDIARAIEAGDAGKLQQLKGIGSRTAQKIIATLQGKMDKFALIRKADEPQPEPLSDFSVGVMEVLVKQLGHKKGEARRMIAAALQRNPAVSTPEALFEEVYRGEVDL
jgi:holliday junction DNA helicase RuvA